MKRTKISKINQFRENIENRYTRTGSFGEILCFELHEQRINPRMKHKTSNNGFCTGLTFKELADKWGIDVAFLGELIADHCKKL